MKSIGIITQARMSSTRLPGKVLRTIKGKTLLEYHVERAQKTNYPVIIATSTDSSDNVIESFCQQQNWPCFRGELNNVLSRFFNAARKNSFSVIVRLTADCPLIDPDLIQQSIVSLQKTHADYVSNTIDRTYPAGFDVETFSFQALKQAHQHATRNPEREHVTPYIWQHPEIFSIQQMTEPINKSKYRLTVDEQDDFLLIKKMIEEYSADEKGYREIINILDDYPDLSSINQHVKQKTL